MGHNRKGMAMVQHALEVGRFLDHLVELAMPVWKAVIVASLLAVGWYAADRADPFEILEAPIYQAKPGDQVILHAKVRRDADRMCHATLSRYLYADANQVRYSLGTEFHSAAEIALLEARTPGQMAPVIRIPSNVEPGDASIVTVLLYRCNVTHSLVPITVTLRQPIKILPP